MKRVSQWLMLGPNGLRWHSNTATYDSEFGRGSGEYPFDDLGYRIRCDLSDRVSTSGRTTVADAEMLTRAQTYVMDCHSLIAWHEASWWSHWAHLRTPRWWLHQFGWHRWCARLFICEDPGTLARVQAKLDEHRMTKGDAA